ncbi:MFS transporter [Streptomyces sp. AJS327]|uniref:MFS transporter n=1 Tax=Streptomyces sp. AJS327 TaxID=2545265 RepID=UPI0015DFF7A0|nr:MFS transporter [Streptomyces sp. AJS327]MBA0052846.1 MFS transporter [Streptomyces sp. AJS327]
MRGPLRLLDVRPLRTSVSFRDLWISTSASQLASQLAMVTVLAQVWELTGSPLGTGVLGLATGLPTLLFGLVGGALADTVDRRALVWATTLGQLLSAAGLCVQALADSRSVALLLGLVVLGAACGALGAPARRTFPVRLLPTDQVASGLALTSLSFQAAMLLGPAVAGLVIARWDFAAAYAGQTGALVLAMITLVRLPSARPGETTAGPDGAAADGEAKVPGSGGKATSAGGRRRAERGGWGVVGRRPTLWGSMAADLSATLLAMPVALFPLVNEARFGGSPGTLGLFLSAVATGGIVAGLLSGTVTRRRRAGLVQLMAASVWGLALAGFGLGGPLWLALGCLVVAGAADTVSVITRSALVQLETPDAYRGRVSSVDYVIGVAGPELGNFRGGLVASVSSASVALVGGGLSATLAIAAVAVANPELRGYRSPVPARSPEGASPPPPEADDTAPATVTP